MTNPNEKFEWTEVDQRAVDTARLLAADAVEKVGSGHPGTPMMTVGKVATVSSSPPATHR